MQTRPDTDMLPIAALGVQLGILSQLYAGFMTRLLDPHGLTYPQFTLLMHLTRRTEPCRISDVSSAVDLTQSAVTKAVQKFQKMGWVEVLRDSADQRNRPIRVTGEGRAHVGAILKDFGPAFSRMLDGWDEADITRLTGDVGRLAAWLDAERRRDR